MARELDVALLTTASGSREKSELTFLRTLQSSKKQDFFPPPPQVIPSRLRLCEMTVLIKLIKSERRSHVGSESPTGGWQTQGVTGVAAVTGLD